MGLRRTVNWPPGQEVVGTLLELKRRARLVQRVAGLSGAIELGVFSFWWIARNLEIIWGYVRFAESEKPFTLAGFRADSPWSVSTKRWRFVAHRAFASVDAWASLLHLSA